MSRGRNERGMTLIEILVVMVLLAFLAGLVGPSIGRGLDKLLLQRTASELVARFRKAAAVARAAQTPVAVTYGNHEFRFFKNSDRLADFRLPASIAPASGSETATFLFLPSGQIVGAEHLQLHDEHGRDVIIRMDFLDGIRVIAKTTP
jgi:type II secretion system protein H